MHSLSLLRDSVVPKAFASLLGLSLSWFSAIGCHASEKLNLAPSAELNYEIKAKQSHIPISGSALVKWQLSGSENEQKYSVITETKAALFGKILDASSHGSISANGLVPDKFVEKRFGKPESTTRFDRENKIIRFTESTQTYVIKGGEQDRTSATWQLINLARSTPEKFVNGSEWKMFVAGRRDADPWTFKVAGKETISTALGEFSSIHLIKEPPPDSKDQQLEIWLAPSLEWYPVRLLFSDADGDFVDQRLKSIVKNTN